MADFKIESKFKIGDKVKINNPHYNSYYGFSDSDLIVKGIKHNKSDNINFDNQVILNLKTLNGKSIEGEDNDIWVFEKYVDF